MSRRILFSISLILVCFLSTFVSSANITVHVGGKDEKTGLPTLSFRPQNVTVVKGDTIVWIFDGGNHNVVQSDGPDGSCELSTATDACK
nr:12376_t:CDS:2 [Entrophospora candida]